jgi:hypothetical protein
MMNAAPLKTTRTRKAIWAGRILSGIAVLFLAFDAAMKILAVPAAVECTTQLGYPASTLLGIGVVQLVCLALYLIPRTAPLRAILWTGYLGGAIATHVRVGNADAPLLPPLARLHDLPYPEATLRCMI